MGLRDDAAQWADKNSNVRQAQEEAAAAAAAPLRAPDWHAELVAELRSLRVPQFPVCTREVRKRLWKSDEKVVYTRTGEAAWVVRYRIPDGGFHSGWRPWEHLGITDTAIGHVSLYGNHNGVGFRPFKQSDGREAANWRPYVVSLFSALLDSRTSEVDHATGTEIEVLRAPAGR